MVGRWGGGGAAGRGSHFEFNFGRCVASAFAFEDWGITHRAMSPTVVLFTTGNLFWLGINAGTNYYRQTYVYYLPIF